MAMMKAMITSQAASGNGAPAECAAQTSTAAVPGNFQQQLSDPQSQVLQLMVHNAGPKQRVAAGGCVWCDS